ncbi:hypothetical protein OAS_00575 [Vibrio cyclitrophicus ZF65]|nr:hypothetical protein OAS_00575 [Vibrio cyclitrophicus ZF65]
MTKKYAKWGCSVSKLNYATKPDREADSAKDLRRFGSINWLTRTKKTSTFRHEGQFKTAEVIGRKLNPDIKGVVSIRGREGYLFVGETKVELQRKSEKFASQAPE